MLGWITGAARSQSVADPTTDQDISCLQEPPETPAPLFAVRAFKTAIFGTPVPVNDTAKVGLRPAKIQHKVEEDIVAGLEPQSFQELDMSGVQIAKLNVDAFASPAKGILMTPGTGTTRRKTVSFDARAKMEQSRVQIAAKNVVNLDVTDESPSLDTTVNTMQPKQPHLTSLNRRLFEERKGEKNKPVKLSPTKLRSAQTAATTAKQQYTCKDDIKDADFTIDLNDPRSRSGKHWKQEFLQYHEKSDFEMRQLIKHDQTIKSYAAKRDADAVDSDSKMRDLLDELAQRESKVSRLAAQLAEMAETGKFEGDAPSQEEMLALLAEQTARAFRYREKAEKYRAGTHRKKDMSQLKKTNQGHHGEKQKDDVLSRIPGEQKYRNPSDEMSFLRSEVETLQFALEDAESKAEDLEDQNARYEKAMKRYKDELSSFTIRNEAREEREKQSDERRRDAKRKMKAALQQSKAEREAQIILIEDLQQQIKELKAEALNLQPNILQQQQRKASQELRHAREELRTLQIENDGLKNGIKISGRQKYLSEGRDGGTQLLSESDDIWTDIAEATHLPKDILADPVAQNRNKNNTQPHNRPHHILTEIDQNDTNQQRYKVDRKQAQDLAYQADVPQTSPRTNTNSSPPPNLTPMSTDLHHHKRLPDHPSPSPSNSTVNYIHPKTLPLPLRSRSSARTTVALSSRLPLNEHRVPRRRGASMPLASSRTGSFAADKSRPPFTSLPAERIALAKTSIENRKARLQGQGRKGKGKERAVD
ncbi:hypothetical protein MMC14_005813 [Varicellaria rhodocarpa]|nr:hypothetical protein [Varicellaria rhodocarpa]